MKWSVWKMVITYFMYRYPPKARVKARVKSRAKMIVLTVVWSCYKYTNCNKIDKIL